MDWAKSETKGDPSGRGQYELGSNDGRPGGEPVGVEVGLRIESGFAGPSAKAGSSALRRLLGIGIVNHMIVIYIAVRKVWVTLPAGQVTVIPISPPERRGGLRKARNPKPES